jgi:hypothetical protein
MVTDRGSKGMLNSRLIGIALFSLILTGCANGVLFNNGLYSHIIVPLTFNTEPTEMESSTKLGRGDIEHFQYQVSIEIGSNGIGDIAKKHGIGTVYYADLEKQSFLFGIWQREFIHVYGK